MKTSVYSRLLGLCLFVSVASASASEAVSVEATTDVRVAVLDMSGKLGDQPQLHAALATSLSAGMSREYQTPVRVVIEATDAPWAARQLRMGSCDAVVVIGSSVPTALLKDGVVVEKAIDAGTGDANQTFFLLTHPRDPGLNNAVSGSFDYAMRAPTFRDALAGKEQASAIAASTP